jgi:regulator of sirC expression with transglutaminase-like and TPR domain
VVIHVKGREGRGQGLGTGFVVGTQGLIATNLHVIGEGRAITVELQGGKRYDVTAVEASDRALDLAVIRIENHHLSPLKLGDSDQAKPGQPVVAIGNPHGLERSIVAGVVSGRREIEGRSMIQLAIPLERGNSGGPLLDMQGRVQGILTLKSAVTANLGFAVPANLLKTLLQKPNPIPMSRWLTLGAVDPTQWSPVFGATWRQRGGKILVEGSGNGFGGRSLLLSQQPVPSRPFELAVTVRLDDESGAAGLVFQADGGDKHYGFYPSSGQLRLTRFEGPDVYSWKILRQEPSPHYRPGEWNALRVRIERDRFLCYVNNELVFESTDTGLTAGKVGMAKFRDTRAEFKNFQLADNIAGAAPPAAITQRVNRSIEKLAPTQPPQTALIDSLASDAPASIDILRERAKLLEQQSAQLRKLARAIHERRVQAELAKLVQSKEEAIDLVHGALLIAKLDNDELDVDAYRKEFERMAREVRGRVKADTDEGSKLAQLNEYLFRDNGFHGSRTDYYSRSNSYLNEVLDDREGLPITLSVVYLELARRLGLNVVGVGLPGHFVVKFIPAKREPQLIDVFEGAKPMSREEAARKVEQAAGESLTEEDLAGVSKRTILVRMLRNLMGLARGSQEADTRLRYLDTIIAIAPDSARDRGERALIRSQTGRRVEALADVDWLLEHRPPGLEVERLLEFRRMLERQGP